MTTSDILKTAQNLPLHDPARVALLDAFRQIVHLQTDRANLICACAIIAHGVGTADDYSATAKAAIAGLCDRAADAHKTVDTSAPIV